MQTSSFSVCWDKAERFRNSVSAAACTRLRTELAPFASQQIGLDRLPTGQADRPAHFILAPFRRFEVRYDFQPNICGFDDQPMNHQARMVVASILFKQVNCRSREKSLASFRWQSRSEPQELCTTHGSGFSVIIFRTAKFYLPRLLI